MRTPIVTRTTGLVAKSARLRKPPNRSKPALLNAVTAWNTPHHADCAGVAPAARNDGEQDGRAGRLDDQREQARRGGRSRGRRRGRCRPVAAWASSRSRRPVRRRREQEQERRAGHEPEAADLDQDQDHDLAERAPVRRGVDDDEAGDAHRRRGREQGDDEIRRDAGLAGPWHEEQQRADPDEDGEAGHQHGSRPGGPPDVALRDDPEVLRPGCHAPSLVGGHRRARDSRASRRRPRVGTPAVSRGRS